jgi:hypothetical protein
VRSLVSKFERGRCFYVIMNWPLPYIRLGPLCGNFFNSKINEFVNFNLASNEDALLEWDAPEHTGCKLICKDEALKTNGSTCKDSVCEYY